MCAAASQQACVPWECHACAAGPTAVQVLPWPPASGAPYAWMASAEPAQHQFGMMSDAVFETEYSVTKLVITPRAAELPQSSTALASLHARLTPCLVHSPILSTKRWRPTWYALMPKGRYWSPMQGGSRGPAGGCPPLCSRLRGGGVSAGNFAAGATAIATPRAAFCTAISIMQHTI